MYFPPSTELFSLIKMFHVFLKPIESKLKGSQEKS